MDTKTTYKDLENKVRVLEAEIKLLQKTNERLVIENEYYRNQRVEILIKTESNCHSNLNNLPSPMCVIN